jgi:hypothetical protein
LPPHLCGNDIPIRIGRAILKVALDLPQRSCLVLPDSTDQIGEPHEIVLAGNGHMKLVASFSILGAPPQPRVDAEPQQQRLYTACEFFAA